MSHENEDKMIVHAFASILMSLLGTGVLGVHWFRMAGVRPDGFWLVLFSLFVLGTLVLYRVFRFAFGSQRRTDTVFIALFFGALFIPMLNISDAEISAVEKRTLAKPAHLIENHAINNKFGTQFDAWFSDHFYLRDTMLDIYGAGFGATGSHGNDHGMIGRDNWLFSTDSIPYLNNSNTYTPQELERAGMYIKSLSDWCRRHGKRFVLVILPAKGAVYFEYVRDIRPTRPGAVRRVDQLRDWLKENSDVELLDPLDDLLSHKDAGLLYYKNDSHWNDLGAWYGYQYLMNAIKMRPISTTGTTTDIRERGDLTNLIPGVAPDPHVYTVPTIAQNAKCDDELVSGNVRCVNSNGRGGIFVMHDSFMLALGQYLMNTFKHSHFVWRRVPEGNDLKDMIAPEVDIVAMITVERLLDYMQTDPITQE